VIVTEPSTAGRYADTMAPESRHIVLGAPIPEKKKARFPRRNRAFSVERSRETAEPASFDGEWRSASRSDA